MKKSKTTNNILKKDGMVILRSFFPSERINDLLSAAKKIFEIQFKNKGYPKASNDEKFKNNLIKLFQDDFDAFQNCGKILQSGLYELYRLAYDKKLEKTLVRFGLEMPLVCTRPVLFFNHKSLAKEEHYYKTPRHQDWPSIQSSSDSLVVWIPLVDVSSSNGAVIFYPSSHKLGVLSPELSKSGFAECPKPEHIKPVQPFMRKGDIAIFSTLLVHESGEISNDQIRWSCHFRYTNMLDKEFIKRGFPSPYIYKSIAESRK